MNIRMVAFLSVVIIGVTAVENKKSFQKSIKELGEEIRDRRNLEYSLTLPHSHVASFRSLERRISTPHEKLYQGRPGYGFSRRSRPSLPAPPYAVQMEPMVQYSQKDPLYDASADNLEEGITRNDIAQSKAFSIKLSGDQISDNNFITDNVYTSRGDIPPPGPPYGPVILPYYDHPEPIIEIIIKESNESLPALPTPPPSPRPKEPVQVFYVKYKENPHNGKDVIYDKPIPAITPPTNGESDHHEYTTVAPPEVLSLPPPPSTTLRAIIRPDSEHYHSDSGVHVTFGSEQRSHHQHHDHAVSEGHEESAPHVAVAFPHSPPPQSSSNPVNQFQKRQQPPPNEQRNFQSPNIKQNPFAHPQQRIQYQATNQPNAFQQSPITHQQLPNPNSPVQPFRSASNQFPRLPNAPLFNGPQRPLQNNQSPPLHQAPPSQAPPQIFRQQNFQQPPQPQQQQHQQQQQQHQQQHQQRTQPPTPPNTHRTQFKQPQRPFHQGPQPQQFQFNEHEYLQQNYHTITTEQLATFEQQPPHEKLPPSFRQQPQHFQQGPREQGPPFSISQEEYNKVYNEQLNLLRQQELRNRHRNPIPNNQPGPKFPIEQPKPILNQPPQPPRNQQKPFPQQIPPNRGQLIHAQPSPSPQPPQFQQPIIGSSFIPPGGELVASVPKFEQHLLITPTSNIGNIPNPQVIQHSQHNQHPQHNQHSQHPQHSPLVQQFQQKPNIPDSNTSPAIPHDFLTVFEQNQKEILRLQAKLRMSEEEQKKLIALTQNTAQSSTQSSIIHPSIQTQHNGGNNQFVEFQARNPQNNKPYIAHNTIRPPLISSTGSPNSRVSSTTPQYVTPSTPKVSEKSAPEKKEKKKPIEFELPDEVPDDLRQQLLSSGILENAQISVLDYDKVGDIPIESLPPDQLANFYGAGGGLQIAESSKVASVVNTKGDAVKHEVDQDEASSEHKKTYVDPYAKKRNVEMKVVHFDPSTTKGQKVAEKYVQDGAKQVEPVSLNERYNRYLPLKVNGAHFPLPEVPELSGRKVTSVVVLAPVNYEFPKSDKEGGRSERAAATKSRGVNFIAGDALKRLVKTPTLENYRKWLEKENTTSPDLQSVILLVTGKGNTETDKEIFMYDVATQTVSKLSGELSTAFVDVAETNALSKDLDQITIADSGIVESSVKLVEKPNQNKKEKYSNHKSVFTEVDPKKRLPVDSAAKHPEYSTKIVENPSVRYSETQRIDNQNDDSKTPNQVSISSGYSRMKMGRNLRTDE